MSFQVLGHDEDHLRVLDVCAPPSPGGVDLRRLFSVVLLDGQIPIPVCLEDAPTGDQQRGCGEARSAAPRPRDPGALLVVPILLLRLAVRSHLSVRCELAGFVRCLSVLSASMIGREMFGNPNRHEVNIIETNVRYFEPQQTRSLKGYAWLHRRSKAEEAFCYDL